MRVEILAVCPCLDDREVAGPSDLLEKLEAHESFIFAACFAVLLERGYCGSF
jgi:hypothetical protein